MSKCGFCQESNPAHEVQQDFAVAIRALSKKSDWLQKVLSGAQQVLVDELALGVAGDAGANFSWLEGPSSVCSLVASAKQHE